MPQENSIDYAYSDGEPTSAHSYVLPAVLRMLDGHEWRRTERRVFDLGCGNGSVAAALEQRGYVVSGIDASEAAVEMAKRHHPNARIELGSAYEDLAARFGRFEAVVSLEVVEHLYSPRLFARRFRDLMEPGGFGIISTPYHGYWKNVALALSGRMDSHFTALWDNGHIKFWSIPSIRRLLGEAGLKVERVVRVGRVPALAKSMVLRVVAED